MKIKFVRIDPIVNKIEISVDGGKTWSGGPVDEAAKSQLLANGFPLDDVKNKPGFNINKILIKANDGEASKTCLDIIIEPNLQEYTLKYIPYTYGSSQDANVGSQSIYYAGNLALLNNKNDLLSYLLFQYNLDRTSVDRIGTGNQIPLSFAIDSRELPDNGLDFLYAESYDGTPITIGNDITDSYYFMGVDQANKRSIIISKGVVRIDDDTIIAFNDHQGGLSIASPKGLSYTKSGGEDDRTQFLTMDIAYPPR